MKGRGAARAPGGREGEGGLETPDRGPGARRPLSAAPSPPPGSCLAATGTSARVCRVQQGPGAGLAPLVLGSSGMRASPGRGARAWALSSSRRAAPETSVWSGGAGPWRVRFPAAPPPGPSCLGRDGFRLSGLRQPSRWNLRFGVVWGFQGEG